MTVRELSERLGADELIEWMAFYKLDPFGGYRTDVNAALIASTMANIHRSADSTEYDLDHFVLFDRHPQASLDVDHAYIASATAAFFTKLKGVNNGR